MTEVLLFDTHSRSHLAARLHTATCPLVAAARRSHGLVKVIEGAEVEDEVAWANDNGWPVRRCKCLTRARRSSVSGKNYLLHLRQGFSDFTLCGRSVAKVNCAVGPATTIEEICKQCGRHRGR